VTEFSFNGWITCTTQYLEIKFKQVIFLITIEFICRQLSLPNYMPFFRIHNILALICTAWLLPAHAYIYVVEPASMKICHGGEPCTFQWLDNGVAPLLTDIGACHVALFNGERKLVQQIEPVNVATVHSVQFIPNPMAGSDSNEYYINFTSVNSINGASYSQYSSFFQLDHMTGSLDSAIPSLTEAIPVPSSLTSSSSTPATSSTSTTSSQGMSISRTNSPALSSTNGPSGSTQSNSSPSLTRLDLQWIIYSSAVVMFGTVSCY